MAEAPKRSDKVLATAAKGKQIIAGVLLALMFLVVAVGTVELVLVVFAEIAKSLTAPTSGTFLLSEEGLFAIFGLFLNVLIAIELIETVEVYFREHALHAETVILVAIIAVARKAILLDLSKYDAATIAALSLLIVSLGIAYFMVRRSCTLTQW